MKESDRMADERRGPETSLTGMIKEIAEEAGVSQVVAWKVVHAFLNAVGRNLASGVRTKISNFGSFSASERRFRNPATGTMQEPVMYPHWHPTGLVVEAVRNGQTDASLSKRSGKSLTPAE
jgi:nucleoid DNA-binding protein